MHILVMAMNYAPEKTAGRIRAELCEYLVSVGHKVSVATAFPHYPEWQIHEGYRGRLFQREKLNGVSVYRSFVYVPRNMTAWQRVLYDTSFALSSLVSGLLVCDVDVILCVSPPLQLGITGYILSRLKRAHFGLQIIDLIIEAAVTLGVLREGKAVQMAQMMERFVYRKAEAIVVICQGFADNLRAKGVPDSKISVFSDSIDTDVIRPLERDNAFRHEQGLRPEDFVVLYSGNLGVKQGLGTLVEAADRLRGDPRIVFFIIGEGMMKADLEAEVARRQLSNVRFLPLQPMDALSQSLSAADALVLTQRADVVDIVIPSKLLTYMAAGRPVVVAVNPKSEAGRYVREADCGLVVPPEDPEALAKAIRSLSADPRSVTRLGANARAFAEQHFSKTVVLHKYDEFFRRICAQGTGEGLTLDK